MPARFSPGWIDRATRLLRVYGSRRCYRFECGNRWQGGLGGFWKFSGGFDDLLREEVSDVRFIAGNSEIGVAEKLFLAIAERVADGLADLRVVHATQFRGFASHQFEDPDAVFQEEGLAYLTGFQRENGVFQGGIGLI